MRAVVYTRYSSDQQRAASIEDQIRLARELIEHRGWTLVQVFEDRALSGATTLRPAYQALLEGIRTRSFDVVVAEALDRLSRDQEDVSALYKRMRFAGIQLMTVAEGHIDELHVGLKGTMNALFLRDLAQKTHRGLRGRVETGHFGGGRCYGYAAVKATDATGNPLRGERRIVTEEAAVGAAPNSTGHGAQP